MKRDKGEKLKIKREGKKKVNIFFYVDLIDF